MIVPQDKTFVLPNKDRVSILMTAKKKKTKKTKKAKR